MTSPTTFEIVTSRSVVRRAFRIALIVGVLLAIINYGDRMMGAGLAGRDFLKIALTFLVPYAVSTVTSVLAVRDHEQVLDPPSE